MANTLDLLTRLYDATECLSDGICGHEDPDETCIVCTVGAYLERRYAAARETAALREFAQVVREALDPGHATTGQQAPGEVALVCIRTALGELDATRGGEA